MSLVSAKGLTHLTVKEIIETAQINRSTFYSYYLDKFDLLEKLETEILSDLRTLIDANLADTMQFQELDQNFQIYPVVQEIINYIAKNFDLVKTLLGPNGDPSFEVQAKQLISTVIDADLHHRKGTNQMTSAIPQHFAHELIVSQLFDIISIWLAEEHPTAPEEIATIIQKTRYLSPYDILDIED